jgi:hypothetical protein
MKKIIFSVLFVTCLAPVSLAQDTITENDTCYMFWPNTHPLLYTYWTLARTSYYENVATPGTMVYGVSLHGNLPLDSSINVSLAWKEKGSEYTYYDTAYLDSSVVYRHLSFRANVYPPAYDETIYDCMVICNEIYFHRPWFVPDTFHVVIRAPLLPLERRRIETPRSSLLPQRYTLITDVNGEPVFPELNSLWGNNPAWQWGDEFPILEPDRTRCGRPTGVHFESRGDSWALLAWNGGSGDSYRVTLEGPHDTLTFVTADTALLLDSLAPDAAYWVEVRSLCRYQYHGFDSSFVNPGRYRMGFRTSSVGMVTAGDEWHTTLYPNPARGTVEIFSSQPLTHIEIVDALGRVTDTRPLAPQNTATLDVSSWPRGTYLLRIHTPLGTATKKLLVQ